MASKFTCDTDWYYKILIKYFHEYYNRDPDDSEKLRLKEGAERPAQLARPLSTKEDFAILVAKIHGLEVSEAINREQELPKIEGFWNMFINQGQDFKSNSQYFQSGPTGGSRKPQHSYCSQEEMDRRNRKSEDNDNDSDVTLKAASEESDPQQQGNFKNVETAAPTSTLLSTTTTTATAVTTVSTITTASGQQQKIGGHTRITATAQSGTHPFSSRSFPTFYSNLLGTLMRFPTHQRVKSVPSRESLHSLFTCQGEEPASSAQSSGPAKTGSDSYQPITTLAPMVPTTQNEITDWDYNPRTEPIISDIERDEFKHEVELKKITESYNEIQRILNGEKIMISVHEYTGKLEKLEIDCNNFYMISEQLQKDFAEMGKTRLAEFYGRKMVDIKMAFNRLQNAVLQHICEMSENSSFSDFTDISDNNKEFVVVSGNNDEKAALGAQQMDTPNKPVAAATNVSSMHNYNSHGAAGHGGGIGTTTSKDVNPNSYGLFNTEPVRTQYGSWSQQQTGYDASNKQENNFNGKRTTSAYHAQPNQNVPMTIQSNQSRDSQLFEQFCEFMKIQDQRSKPYIPHVPQPSGQDFRRQNNDLEFLGQLQRPTFPHHATQQQFQNLQPYIPSAQSVPTMTTRSTRQPLQPTVNFPDFQHTRTQPNVSMAHTIGQQQVPHSNVGFNPAGHQTHHFQHEPNSSPYDQGFGQFQEPTNQNVNQQSNFRKSNLKMEIPSLDVSADIFDFHHFKASFTAVINEDMLSGSQKMVHLKNAVKGKAHKEAIMNLPYSDYGYQLAMEELEDRFGDINALKMAILVKIEQFDADTKKPNGLFQLISLVTSILANKCFEVEVELSSLLFTKIKLKMDHEARIGFDREVPPSHQTLKILGGYLKRLAKERKSWEVMQMMNKASQRPTFKTKQYNVTTEKPDTEKPKKQMPNCVVCGKSHYIYQCLKEKKPTEVESIVKKHNLCYNCFSPKHGVKECPSNFRCKTCKRKHNTLLHQDSKMVKNISTNNAVTIETNYIDPEIKEKIEQLMPTKHSALVTPGKVKNIKTQEEKESIVYHDFGSDETMISTELSEALGLEPEIYTDVTVGTVNGKKTYTDTPIVKFQLSSMDGRKRFTMVCRQMDKIPTCTYKDPVEVKDKYPHLQDIQVYPTTATKVGLSIGRDYISMFKHEQVLEGKKDEPIAFKLPLGWSVCFPRKFYEDEDEESSCNFIRTLSCSIKQFSQSLVPMDFSEDKKEEHEDLDIQTNEAMRKLLTEDNLIVEEKPPFNKDEAEAYKQVQQSFRYTEDGRPEVGIPFNEKVHKLENNLPMALGRLNTAMYRLQKAKIVKDYHAKIQEGVRKGYYEEVHDKHPHLGQKSYIPTQVVIRLERVSNRIRVVNNARAIYKGLSLNDTIRSGPNLQPDMPQIIIGFRKEDIALACDVSDMFPQVIVREKDRDMLRFLIKDPEDDNFKIYRHKRLPLGLNCSPFIAQYTVIETAKLMKEQCPIGYKLIMQQRYVDDILSSLSTIEEAKQALKEVQEILNRCKMILHKVLSNSEEILETIDQEKRLKQWKKGTELPSTKVLGMIWNPNTDMMNIASPKVEQVPTTKRMCLVTSAKLYDPQGMLAPFLVLIRLLLQRLWATGLKWDDPLPPEYQKEAQKWFNQLGMLEDVKFPRKIVKGTPETLHVFADSSDYAYGIAVYLQTNEDSGLVLAKSRVHTLKPKSIPRKELQAALLASKVIPTLKEVFPDIPIILWTDSQNVLAWIQSDSRQFKPYINNRVSAILENTLPEQWRWVDTSNNPADISSRGMQLSELKECQLWWRGPSFLWNKEVAWPPLKKYLKTEEELKKNIIKEIFVNHIKPQWLPDTDQYETLNDLIMATVREAKKLNNEDTDITLKDRNNALQSLIKDAQRERFEQEIQALEHDKPVPARSKIVKLSPYLDSDKILRCWTRLQAAPNIPESAARPILLPKDHPLTTKIIQHEHEKTKHAYGTDYTLSEVRRLYWIPSGRQQIKKVLKNCRQCKINFGMPKPPKMAMLPAIRLEGTMKPFTNASVDFSGAYITVQGRGKRRCKRYLCLFVCNETRAVHCEMAYNMETDGFLMCLSNFTARKGKIKTLTSDNGTNFRGAERELGQLIQQLDENQIQQHATENGFEFKFNPPGAPHMGGVFESLIKSAKRAIRAVLKNVEFTDAELNSAFIGAEDLLNSRPLGYQTNDINDPRVLTPNSFIHGRLDGSFLPPSVDNKDFDIRNRWRLVQQALKHIWRRWMQEILPNLGPRQKWTSDNRNFQQGDEVLIVDKNLPRYRWNIGRVTEVYPGRDGVVRIVDVKDNNGIELKKTVHRLIPLS